MTNKLIFVIYIVMTSSEFVELVLLNEEVDG